MVYNAMVPMLAVIFGLAAFAFGMGSLANPAGRVHMLYEFRRSRAMQTLTGLACLALGGAVLVLVPLGQALLGIVVVVLGWAVLGGGMLLVAWPDPLLSAARETDLRQVRLLALSVVMGGIALFLSGMWTYLGQEPPRPDMVPGERLAELRWDSGASPLGSGKGMAPAD